jgi:hypothetical protein
VPLIILAHVTITIIIIVPQSSGFGAIFLIIFYNKLLSKCGAVFETPHENS